MQDHDFLGFVKLPLADIVAAPGQVTKVPLLDKNGKKMGQSSIIIRCEEVSKIKDSLVITVAGADLDKKDFFGYVL